MELTIDSIVVGCVYRTGEGATGDKSIAMRQVADGWLVTERIDPHERPAVQELERGFPDREVALAFFRAAFDSLTAGL